MKKIIIPTKEQRELKVLTKENETLKKEMADLWFAIISRGDK